MGEMTVRIGLLGALDVASAHPLGPVPEAHASQAAEVVAYLAVHPAGVTGEQLSADLWPTRPASQATRHSAINRARRWLGAAADGQLHLPITRDGSRYRLQRVTTDWSAFQRLAGRDPRRASTADLMAAVRLIRGRPFADALHGRTRVRVGRYTWAIAHEATMLSAMLGACLELAHRPDTNPTIATAAADTALTLDRTSEAAWRASISLAWVAGRMAQVDQLTRELRRVLADELDTQPSTLTAELLRRVTRDLVAWRLGIDPAPDTPTLGA